MRMIIKSIITASVMKSMKTKLWKSKTDNK